MKKFFVIFIIAITCIALGIFVGINMHDGVSIKDKKLVGTYKTSTWNGKDAVLVLKEDGTCIHPTGSSGTWNVEDDVVMIEFKSSYENDTSTTKQKATIVDKGLMLGTHFFEKL